MAQSSDQIISGLSSIGIDIGKNTFHLVGFDDSGKIALRRKIKRLALVAEFRKLPRCIVGMEACLSAHFVSRTLRGLGFEPRIIPAKYTKPFVKGAEERLQRRRGDCRSRVTPELTVCSGEVPGSTRPTGVASGALPIGVAAYGNDQPDPSVSPRARDCGSYRHPCVTQVTVCDLAEPRGRDIAAHERYPCRALRRLALARRAHRKYDL